jgi:glucokinase
VSPATVGVDVGGTSTRIVTVDAGGTVVRAHRVPTPRGAEPLVAMLVELVRGAIDAHEVDLVGVGLPGRVDAELGTVDTALNLGIGAPVAVGAALAHAVGRPVVVENDVNAAALGAADALGFGPRGSLAFVSIGTGLAAGVVVDGRLQRGATGAAGEIGHLQVPGADASCPCGQRGCLEAVASGGGMLRRWGRTGTDVAALWDAADRGEPDARAIRDDAVGAIAWAVLLEVLALDVRHVVLGGGVSGLGARLVNPVCDVLRERERTSPLLAALAPTDRVHGAPLGVELGAIGAALAARLADEGDRAGGGPS